MAARPKVRRICQLAGTPFIVDTFWQNKRAGYSFQPIFFLTHFHADHIAGIKDGWEAGPIYCTAVTRALLLDKFPGLDPDVVVSKCTCDIRGQVAQYWLVATVHGVPLEGVWTMSQF